MKMGVDEVRPLLDFFDYVKGNIGNKEKPIRSPEDLFHYVEHMDKPSKNLVQLLFVDTKNIPIHANKARLSRLDDVKRSIGEGLHAGSAKVFISYSEESDIEKIDKLEKLLDLIGTQVLDKVQYSDKNRTYTSILGSDRYSLSDSPTIIKESGETTFPDLSKKDNYNEFAEYVTRQEIKGMDVIKERGILLDKLKIVDRCQ